jgi:diguanylate cyclase (GGDEF)-like protein
VLDRLQSLNARFGQELGDRVLKALAEHMKDGLEDSDVLFRWSGPTIVALIWREDSIEQVRKSVRHLFETPFEKEFDLSGRSVMIPIGAAWSVIGLIPPAVNSFNYIDRFVAGQTPKDYC